MTLRTNPPSQLGRRSASGLLFSLLLGGLSGACFAWGYDRLSVSPPPGTMSTWLHGDTSHWRSRERAKAVVWLGAGGIALGVWTLRLAWASPEPPPHPRSLRLTAASALVLAQGTLWSGVSKALLGQHRPLAGTGLIPYKSVGPEVAITLSGFVAGGLACGVVLALPLGPHLLRRLRSVQFLVLFSTTVGIHLVVRT